MRFLVFYTLGYIGYFALGFIALRFLVVQRDITGYVITFIGLILLINYVSFIEKKIETPKYNGYVKVTLMVIFFISSFFLIKDSIFQ